MRHFIKTDTKYKCYQIWSGLQQYFEPQNTRMWWKKRRSKTTFVSCINMALKIFDSHKSNRFFLFLQCNEHVIVCIERNRKTPFSLSKNFTECQNTFYNINQQMSIEKFSSQSSAKSYNWLLLLINNFIFRSITRAKTVIMYRITKTPIQWPTKLRWKNNTVKQSHI